MRRSFLHARSRPELVLSQASLRRRVLKRPAARICREAGAAVGLNVGPAVGMNVADAHVLVRQLVCVWALRAPPTLRAAVSTAWARCWWGMPSFRVQQCSITSSGSSLFPRSGMGRSLTSTTSLRSPSRKAASLPDPVSASPTTSSPTLVVLFRGKDHVMWPRQDERRARSIIANQRRL